MPQPADPEEKSISPPIEKQEHAKAKSVRAPIEKQGPTKTKTSEGISDAPMENPEPAGPIKKIILLGERHSGTNWITDHLSECFRGDLKVGLPFEL